MKTEQARRLDTFLSDATDYAAVRPEYPTELLQVAVTLAGLEPGASLLEFGCGTGQATRWFADQGFKLLSIDRSEAMVRVAQSRLGDRPNVRIRCQEFEELEARAEYDGVIAATSYHWLNPATRAARCANHLKPGSSLILLWHTHPTPFTGFFERVQRIYQRVVPDWPPPPANVEEERVKTIRDELENSGLYSAVERRNLEWSRMYSRADYQRLLNTYSDHASLPEPERRDLIQSIGELIDREFDGAVVRPYGTELLVARRS